MRDMGKPMTLISRRTIGLGLLAVLYFAACGPGEDNGPPPPTVYKDYALVVSTGSNTLFSFAIDRESAGRPFESGQARSLIALFLATYLS